MTATDAPAADAHWWDSALCAQVDPDLFFPAKGRSDVAARGQRICAACPVRNACRDDAHRRGERYGTWGGVTERQRLRGRADASRPYPRPTPRRRDVID